MEEVVRYAQVEFSNVLCALKIIHIVVIIFRRILFENVCVGIILLSDYSIISVNDLSVIV